MASPHGISLQITIHIDPKNVDEFFKHFKPLYDLVCAEPELHFFEVYQSREDPGTLSWVEHWNCTVEWLQEVQLKKEYLHEFLAVTAPLYLGPREAVIRNRMGPPYSVWKDAVTKA
ncbi:hypothetical protein B0T25DRAFT_570847 [Lasiosphaeria hispida]|uniref:ABM domain-containing protein n=1 Tax=Lasiosphaeria hispida TaxID=260671 RepID=A0AAJ0HGQ9_9PEZI|nr:hypothetical protein B0T25DRAFT_570847 [Lasiosphaeria hispida]